MLTHEQKYCILSKKGGFEMNKLKQYEENVFENIKHIDENGNDTYD